MFMATDIVGKIYKKKTEGFYVVNECNALIPNNRKYFA